MAWRERLLEDGDEALAELLDQHPAADRQLVRQLVRNAPGRRRSARRARSASCFVLRALVAEEESADAPSDDRAHGEDDIDDENIGA